MLMPNLLLKNPLKIPSRKIISMRWNAWHKGEFEELYFEGEPIQASLKIIKKLSSIAEILKKFKQYMAKGNINSALNLLANNMENEVLPLNKDTLSKLIQKHSKGSLKQFHKISY